MWSSRRCPSKPFPPHSGKWKAADLEVQAALDDEACEWQIWSYAPILVANDKAVDPLSLWLSLQGATDDRVQLALDELEKRLPW